MSRHLPPATADILISQLIASLFFFSPILTFQHEPWRIHVCCISITWELLMQRMGIFANVCIDTNSVQLYREILADLSLLSIWTLIPCFGTIAPRQSSSMSFVDPAQGVKENCFRTRTMATLVSNMAKRDPIQLLGPAPNGRKEKDLICCLFSFLNLKMEKMYILVMIISDHPHKKVVKIWFLSWQSRMIGFFSILTCLG